MDDENRPRILTAIVKEASRLHQVYLTEPFEWIERVNSKGIIVHSTAVPGSNSLAIKANTILKCNIKVALALLLDDSKVGEYDELFDKCEVRYPFLRT